ncbi:MAG: hypothetical protein FWE36_01715, partial [Erysipelotrichales bacterium]|nr:hypothetical protein [Erysipelotrichales bacterium]
MMYRRKIIILAVLISLTMLSITTMLVGRYADNETTYPAEPMTITYKDVGGGNFSGTLGYNTPTEHIYGTETVLVDPTKAGNQ